MSWLSTLAVVSLVFQGAGERVSDQVDASAAANPIRKVVNMLQLMQKRVQAEGEKEKQLYDNFECYCSTNGGQLGDSIAAAETKVPQLQKAIEEAEAQKSQDEADLKQHRLDRDAAKDAMTAATSLRKKEAAEYAKLSGDTSTNIDALTKAIAAISKGVAGGFLQTKPAQILKNLVFAKQDMLDIERQAVMSFLSGSQGAGYAPQSGEVLGILKQLSDNMKAALADAIATEENAIKVYKELIAAKEREVEALGGSIEQKLQRSGDLAVKITNMKDDLAGTEEALEGDKQFLADLQGSCDEKKKEWGERVKTRSEELLALAETIKILNDDDALELFKKVLPSASASFVQMKVKASAIRARALSMIRSVRRPDLDFIALALQGKTAGFEKVLAMIDTMVANLKTEQADDDTKKETCAADIDAAEDKKKGLHNTISDLKASIAKAEEGIATLKEEIAALEAGIKALDKSVAEATEQRKEEHAEFTELMASDTAAKDLLNFAKNRLYQFYNPKMHKPAPQRDLTEQQRITVNLGGEIAPAPPPGGIANTGISAFFQVSKGEDAPPPPPETFGAYTKHSEDNAGVIAMVDLLIKDLDKEMAEAKTGEELAQKDYDELMADSAAKRAEDSKLLAEKSSAKAGLETELQENSEANAATGNELMATDKYIASLHGDCDWLLQHFDVRKEARANEIDALGKAKDVLKGASYE